MKALLHVKEAGYLRNIIELFEITYKQECTEVDIHCRISSYHLSMSHSLLKRAVLPALPRSPSSVAAARSLASVTSATPPNDVGSASAMRAASAIFNNQVLHPASGTALSMHQLLPAVQFSTAEYQHAVQHLSEKGYGHRTLTWDQRVVWGDHDQFGHVNHVRYVQWFESARAFYFHQIFGPDSIRPGGSNLSIILGNLNIRYRRPVQGNDTILIAQGAVFPLERPDRFVLRGTAYSLQHRDVVAVADQNCVVFDYERGKPVAIPSTQLDLMKEFAVRNAGAK
jgi:YbgC/YbaW family acyl-CoA thioester hydrolase